MKLEIEVNVADLSRPSSWAALSAVILRSAKRAKMASSRRCS
jgi:hypothetical protein